MYLQDIINEIFTQLEDTMEQMGTEKYCTRSHHLNATIGQHVRHIIDLFESLTNGYESGIVNYDQRKRDKTIETEIATAINALRQIAQLIRVPNKKIMLEAAFGAQHENIVIESNFDRELVYNLEHAIHHMAMIRVGIHELTDIVLSENFGVASSTLKYRAKCAQ